MVGPALASSPPLCTGQSSKCNATDLPSMIELGSQEFWDRLRRDPQLLAAEVCMVDTVDLNGTLHRHPALRAWVNAAHEVARLEEARAEWAVTKARAQVLIRLRAEGTVAKGKTVNVMEAETELDEHVLVVTEQYLVAQERRGVLRAMASALEDRMQMLIQISARQRQEMRDHQ